MKRGRRLIAAMALMLSAGWVRQACADDAIKLGPVQSFGSEAAARDACNPDGVVWADRKTGYYYPRFMPEYGVSPDGAFVCYQGAKRADYWGFGTADSLGARRGRNFPFNPDPFCDYKIDRKTGKGFCAQPGA